MMPDSVDVTLGSGLVRYVSIDTSSGSSIIDLTLQAGQTVEVAVSLPVIELEVSTVSPPGPQGPPGEQGPSGDVTVEQLQGAIGEHVTDTHPHPIYDDGPSLLLLYSNAKV